jgi:hypothetical protein
MAEAMAIARFLGMEEERSAKPMKAERYGIANVSPGELAMKLLSDSSDALAMMRI